MKLFYLLALALLLPVLAAAQDVYEIKFTAGITQYRAALVIYSDGTGTMRVRFYKNGGTTMVQEYMRLEGTDYGTRITGYNAVYPGTSTRYSSYNPDNFYISQDENGVLSCVNVDDAGVRSRAYIRLLTGYTNKQDFLSDFDWKLD